MIRERASVDDFKKIAKENEYFLWHFVGENQHNTNHALWSFFEEKINDYSKQPELHQLKTLLSVTDVPYYESYTKDSMDFLINLGLDAGLLYILRNPWPHKAPDRRFYYVPTVVGFKRNRMVSSTQRVCYCVEGITEIIMDLNPKLLSNIE
jgi:hypothetical protein